MITSIKNADFTPGNAAATVVRKAREDGEEEPIESVFVVAPRFGKKYVYCFNTAPSIGYFSTNHPARRFAIWLTTNQFFDFLMLSVILANCVLLAFDDPPEVPEYVFLGVYTVEMFLKILAQGFVRYKFTYLRDGWNRLDAIVITLGFVALIPSVGNLSGFRALRVLRALRAINALPGLRIMVNSLLSSLQAIVSVFILMFCFIILVAVLGLQLFSGVLRHKCVYFPSMNSTNTSTLFNTTASPISVTTIADGTSFDYAAHVQNSSHWQMERGTPLVCGNATSARSCAPSYVCLPDIGDNPRYGFLNFDDFGWSMLTSFQLVTSDNWEDVYNHIIAAEGATISIFFFIFVIFLGFFYLLNLVLAIVTIAYNKEVEKESGGSRQSPATEVTNQASGPPVDTEDGAFREADTFDCKELVRRLALSTGFEIFIGACIVINTVVLAIEAPFIDEDLDFGLCVCNIVFTVIFVVEAVLKIFALRGFPYFRDKWNNFDFMLVIVSVVELIYTGVEAGTLCGQAKKESHIGTALRTFRLLRVLKLARSWTTMKALLSIISNSLWDVGNLTLIMIIVIYTFALVGTHLFRNYYTPADLNRPGVERWNFSDFVHSCMTIFTILCGEWVLPLYDTMRVSSPFAIFFYLLVIGIGNFLILNLFVALLLNSFNLENWQASVQKVVKKHQMQHQAFDTDFLRRMNIPWLMTKKTHVINDPSRFNITRSSSLPHIPTSASTVSCSRTGVTMASVKPIEEGIQEVKSSTQCALEACLDYRRSQLSFNTADIPRQISFNPADTPRQRLVRSYTYAGPFCVKETKDEDEMENVKPVLRVVPSVPATKMVSEPLHHPKVMNIGGQYLESDTVEDDKSGSGASAISLKRMCSTHTAVSRTTSWASSSPVCLPSVTTAVSGVADTSFNDIRYGSTSSQPEMGDTIVSDMEDPLAFAGPRSQGTMRFQKVSGKIIRNMSQSRKAREQPSSSSWSVYQPSVTSSNGNTVEKKKINPTLLQVTWQKVHKHCKKLVTSSYFEGVVLVLVVASSISLAFEDSTVRPGSSSHRILNTLNIVFAACFSAEMLMKWAGIGLRAYFTNSWNILDFVIVVISLASLDYASAGQISPYAGVRVIRTLRCLRPLRAISRWPSMKVVVNALIRAIPSIANVLLVCLIFWLIFSIVGVQFFGGRFYSCMINGSQVNASLVPNRQACIDTYGNSSWKNAAVNYDNVLNAALALFQVATFEGWIEIMAASVDAVGIHQQPKFENNLFAYIFYVVFIIVGAFFILNLFIGVIIDNFSRIRKDHAAERINDGGGTRLLLTEDQQRWMSTMLRVAYSKPKRVPVRPQNKYQQYCYHISKSAKFDVAIIIIILLNLVVLSIQHHNQSQAVTEALYIMNIFFTVVFFIEAGIKLIGLRTGYFLDSWNIFDFIILILSITAVILESLGQSVISINPTTLRVIRVFRVIRLVRLVHHYRAIRKLIITLTYSLPALVNVGALLLLMIYIYAILGINLFGHVALTGALSDQVNFRTVGKAFLVLFRLSTAAGWNDMLAPLIIEPPDCDPNFEGYPRGNCGYPIGAPIYCVSFTIFTFLIILNLYVAIILENYVEVSEDSIFEDDIDSFYYRWAKFDPKATQFIHIDKVILMIKGLRGALKVEGADSATLAELNLPVYEDHSIHCLDLLKGVVKMRLGNVQENEAMSQVISRIEDRFTERFPRRTARQPIYHTNQAEA